MIVRGKTYEVGITRAELAELLGFADGKVTDVKTSSTQSGVLEIEVWESQ